MLKGGRGKEKGEERRTGGSSFIIEQLKGALPNRSTEWRMMEFVWFHTMNNVYLAPLVSDENGHKYYLIVCFPIFT